MKKYYAVKIPKQPCDLRNEALDWKIWGTLYFRLKEFSAFWEGNEQIKPEIFEIFRNIINGKIHLIHEFWECMISTYTFTILRIIILKIKLK